LPDATLSKPQFIRGAFYGASAVCIWAGWMITTRFGVTTNLSAWDIAALRFATAGLLLLPVLLRRGFAFEKLGWLGLLAVTVGGGVIMVLCIAVGTFFAPAAHGGALFPGVAPLFAALLATALLKEPFPRTKQIGLGLILVGLVAIVGAGVLTISGHTIGHILFLCAAFIWACYTVAVRYAQIDGLHAAAIAVVTSAVLYLPIYLLFLEDGILDVPVRDLAFQAFYQGILQAILSFVLYGHAVRILGASNGAAFGALSPVLVALFAIPLLGEVPSGTDWLGIAFITAGVCLASDAFLPRR
jgi:drug/metabolite transporter (DMT)-like permease